MVNVLENFLPLTAWKPSHGPTLIVFHRNMKDERQTVSSSHWKWRLPSPSLPASSYSCFLLLFLLPQSPSFLLHWRAGDSSQGWGRGTHMAVWVPGQRGPCGPAFLLLAHLSSHPWRARVGAAGEGGHEAEAEPFVHEAVDDGVDAGGGVREQEDEGNGGPWEAALGRGGVIGPPGIGAEDGHPAQEEEDHDDHEHADHPLLGHQVGCWAAAPDAVDPAAAAGGGQLLKLQLPWVLGLLQVAPVTVLVSAAAGAQFPFWVGKWHHLLVGMGHARQKAWNPCTPPSSGPNQTWTGELGGEPWPCTDMKKSFPSNKKLLKTNKITYNIWYT